MAPDGRTLLNITPAECTYTASSAKQSFYIPDIEAYTLQIQHSVAVPILGTAWSKDDMCVVNSAALLSLMRVSHSQFLLHRARSRVSGAIVDSNGNTVNPCNFYKKRNPNAPCPYNFDSPVANRTHCEYTHG